MSALRPLFRALRRPATGGGRGGRRRLSALAPAVVLAAAFVAAQALAITHDVGPEGHPAGEVCTLCISLGSLGAADAAPQHAAPLPAADVAVVSNGPVPFLAVPRAAHRARAPPVPS